MTKYMTGEQRAAQEAQDLARLEGQAQDPQTVDTHDAGTEAPAPVDWEQRYKDLQSYAAKQVNELRAQIPAQELETENEKLVRQVAELHEAQRQREVADAVAEAQVIVGQAHPDFGSIITSPQFAQWIEAQPEVFKNAIYDEIPDAQLAIKALTLFKAENQPQTPEATQRQPDSASLAVKVGSREVPQDVHGPKVWSMAEIQRMTPQQYAQHEAELDKAFVEGRIRP